MTSQGTATRASDLCVCRGCGTTAPVERARIMGVWSVIDDQEVWDCDDCARSHIHEIEAGLNRARW
jgi:hypothetical protein